MVSGETEVGAVRFSTSPTERIPHVNQYRITAIDDFCKPSGHLQVLRLIKLLKNADN